MRDKVYYGVAYYPELWDEKEIDQDIERMKELKINTVRIGEFAWSSMERYEGQINLSFFKKVIQRLYSQGISTILCTPTATPPIWMTYNHPERLFVNQEKVAYSHGARQHMCTNNMFFRERVDKIVTAMAKELGELEGVIGWQIDNEMKAHVAECYCETCKDKWHKWLEEKYIDINTLNEAWGTKLWSEEYHTFQQIPQPLPTPFLHNASLMTAYRIFTMEGITEFSNMQVACIRKYSSKDITHNTGLSFNLNNEELFRELDIVSFDAYPAHEHYMHLIFQYDLWRSLKNHRSFWLMETSPSHGGNIEKTRSPHPKGFVKAEALSAFAAGAAGFSYWLWRGQRTGCEITHGALLYSWGTAGLGYNEAKEVGEILQEIEPFILETKVPQAEVALMYSDIARSFFKTEPLEKINYTSQIKYFHEVIASQGIFRDIIYPSADLTGYRVVLTPYIPHLEDDVLDKLEEFVKRGGIWIAGPMSGYRTKDHAVNTDCALGRLERMGGIRVRDFYSATHTEAVISGFEGESSVRHWVTTLETVESEEKATIKSNCHHKTGIVSERNLGEGKIVILGGLPNEEWLAQFIQYYCDQAKVTWRYEVDQRVVAIPRVNQDKQYLMLVNMTGEQIDSVRVKELSIDLDAYSYRIVELS